MIKISDHISPGEAEYLRGQIATIDGAYFRDRAKFRVNLGLNNEKGSYFSCDKKSCPAEIASNIDDISPKVQGLDLESWVINYTKPGGFMPPHIDNEGYFSFSVLVLQSGSGSFVYYPDNDLNHPREISDKAGRLITVNDMSQIHSVPKVKADRYVIIFLYR